MTHPVYIVVLLTPSAGPFVNVRRSSLLSAPGRRQGHPQRRRAEGGGNFAFDTPACAGAAQNHFLTDAAQNHF